MKYRIIIEYHIYYYLKDGFTMTENYSCFPIVKGMFNWQNNLVILYEYLCVKYNEFSFLIIEFWCIVCSF